MGGTVLVRSMLDADDNSGYAHRRTFGGLSGVLYEEYIRYAKDWGYHTAWGLILFGDPSTMMRTSKPRALSVDVTRSLSTRDKEYPLKVNGLKKSDHVKGALSYNGKLIGAALADSNGRIVIPIKNPEHISSGNDATLVVTGHNFVVRTFSVS